MSNFTVNRNGLDQVTLEFMTTGRSEGSVNLRDALLDESKNYVFCVDHLNAPLDGVPINKTLGTELFRVLRRNVGQTLDDALTSNLAQDLWVYTLSRKFYDVASFVRSINNWALGVETTITHAGLTDFRHLGGPHDAVSAAASVVPPLRLLGARTDAQIFGDAANGVEASGRYDMIRFRLAVDGSLVVQMSHDFVNNYVLEFSRYGAEVLGLGDKTIAVSYQPITYDAGQNIVRGAQVQKYFLVATENAEGVPEFTAATWLQNTLAGTNIQQPGGNTREVIVYSEHSLYMTLDQRVKISLSSHLPMLNNLHVKEGKESVDRAIVEVFFDNKVTSSVTFDEEGAYKESKISNTLYAGQYPFIKKSDRSKQWHKLLTSFSLRFFRFSIYVTYRSYSSAKDEWVFETMLLPIDQTKYWDFSLRFLSLV